MWSLGQMGQPWLPSLRMGVSRRGGCPLLIPLVTYTRQLISFNWLVSKSIQVSVRNQAREWAGMWADEEATQRLNTHQVIAWWGDAFSLPWDPQLWACMMNTCMIWLLEPLLISWRSPREDGTWWGSGRKVHFSFVCKTEEGVGGESFSSWEHSQSQGVFSLYYWQF